MRWAETVLYLMSFAGLVYGLWLVVKSGRQISNSLNVAAAASYGIAPPEMAPALYQMSPDLWGSTSAAYLVEAAEAAQKVQTKGAWIATAAGLIGLGATLLAVWAT